MTGIYTVLLHEENDPIGELAKSVLDGHITLSRESGGARSLSRDRRAQFDFARRAAHLQRRA